MLTTARRCGRFFNGYSVHSCRLGTAVVAASVAYFVILGLAVMGGLLVHDIATNGFGVG